MKFRNYDEKKDKNAIYEVLKECGWIKDAKDKYLTLHIKNANTIVSEIDNRAEAVAVSVYGNIKYQNNTLPFSAITGVAVGLIARKRGLAKKLTAKRIQLDALNGAAVVGLSFFDQGFYDKLGFATGAYQNIIHFSPISLKIDRKIPLPKRLSKKDWKIIHKNRLVRKKLHGAVDLPEFVTKADVSYEKDDFGLGFFNEKGKLTHHIWLGGKGKVEGPYNVRYLAYQNYEQFLDLLAVIRNFGEQIMSVKIYEPPHIQMQDFIKTPELYRNITQKSKFENKIETGAWTQMRILDLKKCISATKIDSDEITFNLDLFDPIKNFLDKNDKWHGLSGKYIVTFGKKSFIEKGYKKDLPVMKASIAAFSRFWFGIHKASYLTISNELQAPEELLTILDKKFIVPVPYFDWNF